MPQNIKDRTLLEYFQNYAQCGRCYESCSKASESISCKVCRKWFHRKCGTQSTEEYISMYDNYTCIRCLAHTLPLFDSDNIDFQCALFGDGKTPCKKCKRDILEGMQCTSCLVCNKLYHFECTPKRLSEGSKSTRKHYSEFICSTKCYQNILPFCEFKFDILLEHNVFCISKIKDVQPVDKSSGNAEMDKPKSKPIKHVPLDHFYDINCSYLYPNELNDDHIGCQKSDLSIFQGNVRSLNANFDSVSEIFDKCQSLPDILAITETKLKKGDDEPSIGGYVFERTDTTTEFGGVGVYIPNDFKHTVRSDLALGVRHCEDIWVDINTDQSNKFANCSKNLVIGVIYRHPGHKYDFFCKQLCDTLNKLNASKTDYVIVGDINVDILKFNLATDVTDYINSLYSVGCNVSINRPTRVAKKSATCIDHIYTSMSQERLYSNIIMSDVSDHYSTLTRISGFSKSNEKIDVYSRKSDLSGTVSTKG